VTVARGPGVTGEVVVRRRDRAEGPVFELIVNGTFLMDSAETSTERLLADILLERHPAPSRVLVGGLGLGFTTAALLADRRVERIDVVEIEPLLVRWLGEGVVPGVDSVLADPRVNVVVDDLRAVFDRTVPASYDGILLDVDNGPDFLTREANAAVYAAPALRSAARALDGTGVLAVWSAGPSVSLPVTMTSCVGPVEDVVRWVRRDGRDVEYHVYVARRGGADPGS
jgi:spermidine synthase